MEFTEEFIQENGLSEEQVNAVVSQVTNHVAEIQKEWDGKANENAEGILSGAAKSVQQLTGIQREQGQKVADYIKFAAEKHFEGTKADLERQRQSLDGKLKDFKGGDELKVQLQKAEQDRDSYKEKAARYDEWEQADYKGKYESTAEKLTTTERRIAFKDVQPPKPENVNEYEWKAKWGEWERETLEKNNLVFDENGDAWAVDKENEFKKEKLSNLAKQNTTLQSLLRGREQKGLGSSQKSLHDIEGVPFKVPENPSPQERQKLIKEYLASQNIQEFSKEYSAEYAKLNKQILGLGKKQAD